MIFKNILIVHFLIFLSLTVYSQGQIIQEEEVGLDVLKWFYTQYPKSTYAVWEKANISEQGAVYQVKFIFDETEMIAIYNQSGERLSDSKPVNTPHISLVNFVHDNYEKAKIKEVFQETDFSLDRVTYTLQLKSKENGLEILRFDSDFKVISDLYVSSAK